MIFRALIHYILLVQTVGLIGRTLFVEVHLSIHLVCKTVIRVVIMKYKYGQ